MGPSFTQTGPFRALFGPLPPVREGRIPRKLWRTGVTATAVHRVTRVDHGRAKEVLAAYALGATPDDERPAVEAHVAECTTCRAQLRDFQLAAEQLVDGRVVDLHDDALDRAWKRVLRRLRK
jgi:anti-sigma factor RsiW